ncbi:MAG: hypothetical protein WB996_09675 [Ignavibacteriaceae bacterium]
MEVKDQFNADVFSIMKFNNNTTASEYSLGSNKFINVVVNQSEMNMEECYGNFIHYLLDNNYKIISQFLFGNIQQKILNKEIVSGYFDSINWPLSVISQKGKMWGTLITAIKTDNLKTIYSEDKPLGNYYDDKHSEYVILGDILPPPEIPSKELGTSAVFHLIESTLEKVNMNFTNVVRTWFYLDDLLNWYREFNIERTNYFNSRNVFNTLIPASTGIGVANIDSRHLLSAAFAVKPKSGRVKIKAVPSPLQCPAVDYKSSFSRAVEIEHPNYTNLIISGSASIDLDGQSTNIGDTYKQIELTMDVVYGILNSRGMNWGNVTKAIAYFKNRNDIEYYYNYCDRNNILSMPLVMIEADVCRQELLFEIEMDAIKINKVSAAVL